MARRIWRLAVAVVLVIVVGSLVLVLTSRPTLDHDRTRVDQRWAPLRAPLGTRYQVLAAWTAVLGQGGVSNRAIVTELGVELKRWQRVAAGHDASAQAREANRLEGLAARAGATVKDSARLSSNAAVTQARDRFAATAPNPTLVSAYNDAARAYQRARESTLRRLVVGPLGYDARPTLQIPGA